MTVSTTHVSNSFTGNASTTVFNFTFHALLPSEIQVKLGGVVQNSGYTVTLNSNQVTSPGGSVTFTSAPGNGVAGLIERNTGLTQGVSFTRESLLNTRNLEAVFDRLTLMLQEAAARTQGATGPQGPTGPQGAAGSLTGPGSSTNNNVLLWNGTGGNLAKDGPTPMNEGNILKIVSGVPAWASAAAAFPSGVVAFWPFDPAVVPIPSGWALCDGSSVTINGVSRTTPDSRGKYVLAAAVSDSGSSGYTGATVRAGTVSGQKTHTHANGGGVTTTVDNSGLSATSIFYQAGGNLASNLVNQSTHNHTAGSTIFGSTQASADSDRPIEVAVLMIIKVD